MEPSEKEVRQILEKHFPGRVKTIKRINEGYSHYMYECELDDKSVIARLSTATKEEYTIGKELWVMLQYKRAGIPVPEIFAVDTNRSEMPFEYMIMEKLPGQCLGKIWNTLSKEDKKIIAHELGSFLAKLHSVKMPHFGPVSINGVVKHEEFSFRGEKLQRPEWSLRLLHMAFEDLAGLITYKLVRPEQSARIVQHLHANAHLAEKAEPVLIHNDFHPDHVFVEKQDAKWKIVGICDFELASAYAREFDFIKLHRSGLLQEFKDEILDGYGKDKLHMEFDNVVELYRLVRDLGFSRFTAKKGELELSKKTIANILEKISTSSSL